MLASYVVYAHLINSFCAVKMNSGSNTNVKNKYVYIYKINGLEGEDGSINMEALKKLEFDSLAERTNKFIATPEDYAYFENALNQQISDKHVKIIFSKINYLLQVVKINRDFSNLLGIDDTSNYENNKYILINPLTLSNVIEHKVNSINKAIIQIGFKIKQLSLQDLKKIRGTTNDIKNWKLYEARFSVQLPNYTHLSPLKLKSLVNKVKSLLSNFNQGDLIDSILNPTPAAPVLSSEQQQMMNSLKSENSGASDDEIKRAVMEFISQNQPQ